MRRRFIEILAFFVTLNLLVKPIYVFGIDRVVQNTVGTVNYGTYFPLINLVLIFQIFLDLGIENFTRKELAQSPGLQSRLFSGFLTVRLMLILVFFIAFAIVGYVLPHTNQEWKLLLLLVFNQAIASLILYMRANLGGLQLFKAEGIVSVLDRLFMIVICGFLLLNPVTKNKFKIEWFVIAQSIAYLLTLLISFTLVVKKTTYLKLKFNRLAFIPILKALKPYAILVLLMAFYYRIDSIFLRYFLPDGREQAGIYAHGFRILDFLSNYALIFSLILLPVFSGMLQRKENISPLLKLSTLVLMLPSAALLIGIAFYRFDIFQLLYPGSGKDSANIFLILIVSFTGMCISYTFGALLTANGNLNSLIRMAVIAVIISIILNAILVPHYKAVGAAIANATSQLFTIFYHLITSKKKLGLKTDKQVIFKSAIFILTTIVIGLLISLTSLLWMAGVLLIATLSIGFSFLIGLLKISYLHQLIGNFIKSKDLSTE